MKATLILFTALAGTLLASDKWFPTSSKIEFIGKWGGWGPKEVCHQTYADKFRVQTEGPVSGDDTALNSVCIICKGANGRELCSRKGYWGRWYSSSQCTAGFTAAKYRFENPTKGDDTAGNTLLLRCGTGNNYYGAHHAPDNWGSWYTQYCHHGSRICGIQTRVEGRVDGDDTALNGIRFTCCATVKKVVAYLKTIYHGEGGSGANSYTRIERTVSSGMETTVRMDTTEKNEIATHVGMSVEYGAVKGDASIDVSYLRETFKSTITTTSQNITETKEFKIFLAEPTYLYQARTIIEMSDGSTVEQGIILYIFKNQSCYEVLAALYRTISSNKLISVSY